MANDDFYRQLRERVAGYTGPCASQVLLVPDLFALVTKLMMDGRVPPRQKAWLGAALAYVVSPIDFLPERLLGLPGFIDDAAVIVAALNMLLNDIDQQIVLEHWSGEGDLLTHMKKVLADADQLIGRGRLEKILAALGIHTGASQPAA